MFPASKIKFTRITTRTLKSSGVIALLFFNSYNAASSHSSVENTSPTTKPSVSTKATEGVTTGAGLTILNRQRLRELKEGFTEIELKPDAANGFTYEIKLQSGALVSGENAVLIFCDAISPLITKRSSSRTSVNQVGLLAYDKQSQNLINYCKRIQNESFHTKKHIERNVTVIIAPI